MRRVRVTGPARRDVTEILRQSRDAFGGAARERYRSLIEQALHDLTEDPHRVGVRPIDDIRAGYRLYHLRSSRPSRAHELPGQPRHVVVFRLDESGAVIIARVLHERQMLTRHLAAPADE